MGYVTPKIDWNENYEPSPEDMNRIEGNNLQNHDDINTEEVARIAAVSTEESARIAGDNALDTRVDVLEGTGTPQGVGTSDSPTFNNITASGYIVADSKRITSANYIHGIVTHNTLFDKLSPFIPSTGNIMLLNGGVRSTTTSNIYGSVSRAERTSSTVITIYLFNNDDSNVNSFTITNGSGTSMDASLSW